MAGAVFGELVLQLKHLLLKPELAPKMVPKTGSISKTIAKQNTTTKNTTITTTKSDIQIDERTCTTFICLLNCSKIGGSNHQTVQRFSSSVSSDVAHRSGVTIQPSNLSLLRSVPTRVGSPSVRTEVAHQIRSELRLLTEVGFSPK